jgi:hypothetical protein
MRHDTLLLDLDGFDVSGYALDSDTGRHDRDRGAQCQDQEASQKHEIITAHDLLPRYSFESSQAFRPGILPQRGFRKWPRRLRGIIALRALVALRFS